MMNGQTKLKGTRKRVVVDSRKSDIERAMMELRRLRRAEGKGKKLDVVVTDGVVVVKEKDPVLVRGVRLSEALRAKTKQQYREYLVGLNRQMKITLENSHHDRERIVRTLKEKPSDEALKFYESLAKCHVLK